MKFQRGGHEPFRDRERGYCHDMDRDSRATLPNCFTNALSPRNCRLVWRHTNYTLPIFKLLTNAGLACPPPRSQCGRRAVPKILFRPFSSKEKGQADIISRRLFPFFESRMYGIPKSGTLASKKVISPTQLFLLLRECLFLALGFRKVGAISGIDDMSVVNPVVM